jgi:hypothetical protein
MKNPAYISNVDFSEILTMGYSNPQFHTLPTLFRNVNFVNCDTDIRLCNNENGTDIQQW